MARSIARRACEQLLLVGGRVGVAVLGGHAQPVVREVAQLLLDRCAAARRSSLESISHGRPPPVAARRPAARRGGGRRGRRHARCIAQPGFADATTAAASPAAGADRGDLAVADRGGRAPAAAAAYAPPAPQHRPSSSVSTQVVGGREHGAHGAVRPLHVAEVARVLHDDRVASGRRGAAAAAAVDEPLREVADPRRERARLGACRAGGRSPSSPRRSPALSTTTGASPGSDAITRAASRRASSTRPACIVQRAAAVAAAAREPTARAPAARMTVERGAVDVALPRVHDAAGEQVRVGVGGGRERRAPQRAGREVAAARTGAARGAGAARASSSQVTRASSRWCGQHHRGSRATRRRGAARERRRGGALVRARHGCPP